MVDGYSTKDHQPDHLNPGSRGGSCLRRMFPRSLGSKMLLANVSALLLLCVVYLNAAPRVANETKTRYFLEFKTSPSDINLNEITSSEINPIIEQANQIANERRQKYPASRLPLAITPSEITGKEDNPITGQSNNIAKERSQKDPVAILALSISSSEVTGKEDNPTTENSNKIAKKSSQKDPGSFFALLGKSGLVYQSKSNVNSTEKDDSFKKETNISRIKLNNTHVNFVGNPLLLQREGKTNENINEKNSKPIFLKGSVPQTRETRTLNVFEFSENVSNKETSELIINPTNPENSEKVRQKSAPVVGIISIEGKQISTSGSDNRDSLVGVTSESQVSQTDSGAQNNILIINIPESKDEYNGHQQMQTTIFTDNLSPLTSDLKPDYETENKSSITINLTPENSNIAGNPQTISLTKFEKDDSDNLTAMESIEIEVSKETFNAVVHHQNVEKALNAEILKEETPQMLTQNVEIIPEFVSVGVEQNGDWIITENTNMNEIQISTENKQQKNIMPESNAPQLILLNDVNQLSSEFSDSGASTSNQALNSNSQVTNGQFIAGGTVLNVVTQNNNGQGNTPSPIVISQKQSNPLQPGHTQVYISSDKSDTNQLPMKPPTIQKLEGTLVLQEHDIINKLSTNTDHKSEPIIQHPNPVYRSDPNPSFQTIQVIESNAQGPSNNNRQQVGSPSITKLEPNVHYITTSITQPINSPSNEQMHSSFASSKQQLLNGELINIKEHTQSNIPLMVELQSDEVFQNQVVQYMTSMPQTVNTNVDGTVNSQIIQEEMQRNGQIDLVETGIPVVMEIRNDNVNQGQQVQHSTGTVAQSMKNIVDINDRSSTDTYKQYSSNNDHISNIEIVNADTPVVLELQPNHSNHSTQYVATSVSRPQSIENIVVDNVKSITITQHQDLSNAGNSDVIELVETRIPTVIELQPENVSLDQAMQYVKSIGQPQLVQTANSDHNGKLDIIQAEMPVFVELQPGNPTPDQVIQYVTTSVNQPEPTNEFTDEILRSSIVMQEQDLITSDENGNIELIKAEIPVVIEEQSDNSVQDQLVQYVTTSVTQPINELVVENSDGSLVAISNDGHAEIVEPVHAESPVVFNDLVLENADGSIVAISNDGHAEIVEPVNAEIPVVFELHPDKIVHDYIFKYVTSITQQENEPEEIPELFVSRRNFIFNPDRFVLTTSQGKQIEVHKKYSTDDKISGSNLKTVSTGKNIDSNAQPMNNNYQNQGNVVTLTEIPDSNDGSFTIQTAEQQAPRQHRINSKYRRGPLWWVNTNSGFAPTGGDVAANGYVFSVDGGDVSPNPSEPFSEDDTAK